jgi:hypothetical protein
MDSIRQRWRAFKQKQRFPEGCVGREIDDTDLTSVDTFAAGCIETFVDNGSLDSTRIEVLNRSMQTLRLALPELAGDELLYFEELMALIEGVLRQTRN